MAGNARKDLEKKLGGSVISLANAKSLGRKKDDELESQKCGQFPTRQKQTKKPNRHQLHELKTLIIK